MGRARRCRGSSVGHRRQRHEPAELVGLALVLDLDVGDDLVALVGEEDALAGLHDRRGRGAHGEAAAGARVGGVGGDGGDGGGGDQTAKHGGLLDGLPPHPVQMRVQKSRWSSGQRGTSVTRGARQLGAVVADEAQLEVDRRVDDGDADRRRAHEHGDGGGRGPPAAGVGSADVDVAAIDEHDGAVGDAVGAALERDGAGGQVAHGVVHPHVEAALRALDERDVLPVHVAVDGAASPAPA